MCKFFKDSVGKLINEENSKLCQENEDLKNANETLLEDVLEKSNMCEILAKRVLTLEKSYNEYFHKCMNLEQINDLLNTELGIPLDDRLVSTENC